MGAIKLLLEAPQNADASKELKFLNQLGISRFGDAFSLQLNDQRKLKIIAYHIAGFKIKNKKFFAPPKGLFFVTNNEIAVTSLFQLINHRVSQLFDQENLKNYEDRCNNLRGRPSIEDRSTQDIWYHLVSKKPAEILDPLIRSTHILFLRGIGKEEKIQLPYYNKFDLTPTIFEGRFEHRLKQGKTITYGSLVKPDFSEDELLTKTESSLVIEFLNKRYGRDTIRLIAEQCEIIFLDESFDIKF